MLNKGKCAGVRPAITEKVCEEFQARKAMVCSGCPGPTGELSPPPAAEPEQEVAADAEVTTIIKEALAARPGFFVDFTGHEDLLDRFKAAAEERGLKASESALDLIYLFDEGLLCLRKELWDEEK